jgi:glucosamine-phosphate N-acetyltransferase
MSFRPIVSDDYPKYLSLINEFRPTDFTKEQFVETLAKIHASSEIWVYEKNNELLATGTIIYEHKFIFNTCIYAHIEDICVKATHRRQGLGKRLIQHLIKQASHCYKITLDCADNNIHFYESCGLEHRGNQMCQLLSILMA